MSKIYFAGSITGGRGDKSLYQKIIKLLKNYGQVLTEHIGDQNLSSTGENKDKNFIYKRDIQWIEESDYLIAEVTQPSLGVGFEIATAKSLNKKIICLYRPQENKKLSSMITGCPDLRVFNYQNIKELEKIFNSVFSK